MKLKLAKLFIQLLFLLLGTKLAYSNNFTPIQPESIDEIIHGQDNRLQPFEYIDESLSNLGRSVALVTYKTKLHHFDSDHFIFSSPSLGEKLNLCEGERFSEEPTLGHCSAFLVGKDLVATAGHCVTKEHGNQEEIQSNCRRLRFVFNFTIKELEDNSVLTGKNKTIKKNLVFKCKEVIAHQYKQTKFQQKDYALIKLDRPVTHTSPLTLKKYGLVNGRTKLITIGHPLGIPQKISGEAKVFPFAREENENVFHAFFKKRHIFYSNLDTFAGNSGSPVINEETHEVEGIFIGGDEEDFIFEKESWCRKAKIKPSNRASVKEHVQRIKFIRKLLK